MGVFFLCLVCWGTFLFWEIVFCCSVVNVTVIVFRNACVYEIVGW